MQNLCLLFNYKPKFRNLIEEILRKNRRLRLEGVVTHGKMKNSAAISIIHPTSIKRGNC